MNTAPTKDQITRCVQWVEAVNAHMARLEGTLHDNTEFWQECIHSKTNNDFWDLVTVYKELKIQEPDACNAFWRADYYMSEVERKLHSMGSQPIQQPGRVSKNKDIFTALMNFKDILNYINGKPGPTFTAKKAKSKKVVKFKKTKPTKPRPQLTPDLWEIPDDKKK